MSRALAVVAHGVIVPGVRSERGHRRAGRADHGGDADAVVRRPADRQARDPRHVGPDPGDPVEVADGVLRQRAAPPLHVAVDRRRA